MAVFVYPFRTINSFLNQHEDFRTADFPLMSTPFYTLGICLLYVYVVKWLGPKLMENRKPLHLKWVLVVYNFLQVSFSIWLFYEIGMSGWFTGDYSWKCQPVDYSNKPSTLRMVNASWWYFFSKFTEFMDTIFFVLRKKNEHISTLHVIHHGIMPMSVWFGVKFTPGGHSTFFGLLNSFVHIVMYFYYLLSAFGPHIQKYLWWKKYLTTLQMVQFLGIMLHAFQLLFIDCNYPRAFVWWIGMHAVMFFFLFKEFYNQTYSKKARKGTPNATQNGIVKNAHLNLVDSDEKSSSNGFRQNGNTLHNGIKRITDVNDYYVSGLTSSRIKTD